jgi:hypothetical protein
VNYQPVDRPPVQGQCEGCGKGFTRSAKRGVEARNLFCSNACRVRLFRRKNGLTQREYGTAKQTEASRWRVCGECGTTFRDPAKPLYCSKECRRRVAIRHGSEYRATHPGYGTQSVATLPEVVMAAVLDFAGTHFTSQGRVGDRFVDFLLEDGVVVEVDGVHWHQDPEREARRDQELLAAGASVVHHVTDDQLKQAGFLSRW